MPTAAPRLHMQGIGKSFGGVPVLSGVDFTVEAGEVVALLGSNGAGKSTLMKILTGLYGRDAGTIAVDGETVDFAAPSAAVAAGVRLLPQEISVMPDMTVAENIFAGDLPLKKGLLFRSVDDAAMRRRSRELLDQLGFGAIDPDTVMKRLSVAEQRIVEIARALAGQARILIMDEPTAALTEQEATLIFRIIRRLKAQSVSVVYISHYLSEVFEISDRIAVLRDGRNAGTFRTAETNHADVLAAMLGNTVGDLYAEGGAAKGEEILSVEALSLPGKLDDIGFSIRAGEILGVFGLVGSGIEVLGRAIYGALGPMKAGRIRLGGREYRPASPVAGKRSGIGFVAAERKKEGIIADLTVRENIALSFQERFERGLFVSKSAETSHAKKWIDGLGIRTRGPEQRIRTLSGGNQQKVCIARWLVEGVELLILEEPTRGVDVGARKEIYGKLRDLADRGFAVLVLSSDVEEVAGLGDRALVLDRGRVVGRFGRGATPAQLMAATSADPAFHAA
ncbi:sugar ABC transporter ATP-binding protein [Prosthecomicrobium pneumaticum]|uniref:Ribose transport system ATP-binding protein n=1 Tax=Prosthecomicrobium pneumaticum TaxID=81895 RepID=A0A7W9FPS6_9HYPH|nr:sugar ABC transporter ATP-binding protein [Prosthecomicrobium pneumaticum]MBB5754526.1 ribose transport system ATP-binding protein [Prosthecomicrobium pneumaticum]